VSDTAPSKTGMTREALVGLGAERLAEILSACAREDPQLAERLERALAQAPPVPDWKGIEDHESFMARLQSEHGRKRSFWAEW
jgi:hypothetical protein